MTKLINKDEESIKLWFTLDRKLSGLVLFNIISDYDLSTNTIQLPPARQENERFVLFEITDELAELNDGLYTYQLEDSNGELESGNMKIQSSNLGQNTETNEFNFDGDDEFAVYED
ncbi:hypothetical protein [Sphingobacterium sp. 1.A.5]|uniref:hypothetical protein n=1 Tax=Sphingobacterium sp. 1.A.5 TaxID=2044604 RepID=UPI000C0C0C93|nr:hypothetical protein [Sphingobacterium sp. 1.A.5]